MDTAPGCTAGPEAKAALDDPNRRTKRIGQMQFSDRTELYMVRDAVWKKAGMEEWGGCLCVGCIERRLGRKLKPKDFTDHIFNSRLMPCSPRLRSRRK